MSGDVPPGYLPLPLGTDDFNAVLGPFYGAAFEDGIRLGVRLAARHLNVFGTAHGGAIAGIADMQGLLVQQISGYSNRLTPTVSLSVDYIGPSAAGEWLDFRPKLLHATRSLLFSETKVHSDGRLVARSSAIFKIGPIADRPFATLGRFFAERFPGSVPDLVARA